MFLVDYSDFIHEKWTSQDDQQLVDNIATEVTKFPLLQRKTTSFFQQIKRW